MKHMLYPERLKCLNLDTLEMRRIKYDLSMYFKILHGFVDINDESMFQVRDIRTPNNGLTLFKAKFNSNLERYIFRNRCINIWNLLPHPVVGSNDLFAFKRHLNSYDLHPIIYKASLSNSWSILKLVIVIISHEAPMRCEHLNIAFNVIALICIRFYNMFLYCSWFLNVDNIFIFCHFNFFCDVKMELSDHIYF